MQKVAYFQTDFHTTMKEYVLEKTKQGYVLAGPIHSLNMPKWKWMGFSFGSQIVYEVTLILELGETK